jgi:hypothetical protein
MISMNPVSNESAGAQVPTPEKLPNADAAGKAASGGPASPEQAPNPFEKAAANSRAAPAPGLPPITLPLPPPAPQAAAPKDNSATPVQTSPLTVADDGDLIEKEWVHKAKQIVEANRDDPYRQSEELTVFKADYMKKRYDKNIKLSK